MTSPPPLLFDTYYHIYNRGVNRENIFVEERNYDLFLRLYEKHLAPVTDLFAYCLLKNRFHVSLRVKAEDKIIKTLTPKQRRQAVFDPAKIQAGQLITSTPDFGKSAMPLGSSSLRPHYVSSRFSNFFNAYAKTINKAYGRVGSLFQHPFGRVQITSDRQFWNVIPCIHQNLQKQGAVRKPGGVSHSARAVDQ